MTLKQRIAELNLVELEEKVCEVGNKALPNSKEWKQYQELDNQLQVVYAQLRREFGLTQDQLADKLDGLMA